MTLSISRDPSLPPLVIAFLTLILATGLAACQNEVAPPVGPPEFPGAAFDGVPAIQVPYGSDVHAFWDSHLYNPTNGFDIDQITHPSPIVNVCAYRRGSETAGILEAIDALPSRGGTLWFPKTCSPYVITKGFEVVQDQYLHYGQIPILRRSNLHFVSDGARIVSDPQGFIPSESDPSWWDQFVFTVKSMRFTDNRDEIVLERNYLFENLVFDGGDAATGAFMFTGVRDILFHDTSFVNIRPSGDKGHPAALASGAFADNIWCLRCTFDSGQYAVYWDGTHGSGVVESTFLNGPSGLRNGAVLLLTNDDMAPVAENQRMNQYVVFADNIIQSGRGTVFSVNVANALFTGNQLFGNYNSVFVLAGKPSDTLRDTQPEFRYDHHDVFLENNHLDGVAILSFVTLRTQDRTPELPYFEWWIRNVHIRGNTAQTETFLRINDAPDGGEVYDVIVEGNTFTASRLPRVRIDSGAERLHDIIVRDNVFGGAPRDQVLDNDGDLPAGAIEFRNNTVQ